MKPAPPPIRYRTRTLKSEGRLERMIAERLLPGADQAAIDRRIWDLVGERWAIMYTDLSGFSRRVAEFGDEMPVKDQPGQRQRGGCSNHDGHRRAPAFEVAAPGIEHHQSAHRR